MPMRETVRSGRRENFYVTENSFIDHYAKQLQPTDIAVYHALERYANCHTRSTWVGTAKIAEVLNVSQRTVQRSLKVLEDLKLIRIVQTSTLKMYFIVPVPLRTKTVAIPLFDGIDEIEFSPGDDARVAWTTPMSPVPSSASPRPSPLSRLAPPVSRGSDIHDGRYKEEQDLLNKTKEQDLFNKNLEEENIQIKEAAQRIVTMMGLPGSSIGAATAAVEARRKQARLSMDGTVQDIVTAANLAERRGIERGEFLEDFLAQQSAHRILKSLSLPVTHNFISIVTASVKAEATYTGSSMEEVATIITKAAIGDRRRGIAIDRFYFENVKWRAGNGGRNKAEQQFDRINRAREKAIENIRARSRS